jgi:hypothetical protein
VLAEGVAVTIEGVARVLDEALVEGVVAVEIASESMQDHMRPNFELSSGVRWRWTDSEAQARDTLVREALLWLAEDSVPAPPSAMRDD